MFKRDGFTCQYCGNTPPKVVLEVDHIVPVKSGGKNNEDNLITACFSCNRGKAADGLDVAPATIEEKRKVLQEKEWQVAAYEALVDQKEGRIQQGIERVENIYSTYFEEWVFTDKFKLSVRKFINVLGVEDTEESMTTACMKIHNENKALTYF
ncbi:MAG: HNH endonuclease, partial [Limisphaerales bacterium]